MFRQSSPGANTDTGTVIRQALGRSRGSKEAERRGSGGSKERSRGADECVDGGRGLRKESTESSAAIGGGMCVCVWREWWGGFRQSSSLI